MMKFLGSALLVGGLTLLASAASAQHRTAASSEPTHELGADFAFQFIDRGGGVGGGVQLAAPVDVRLGFLSRSTVMFEVRGTLAYDSKGAGTSSTFVFAPGVNALYQLKRGTGVRGLMHATYATGGVGLNIVKVGAAGTETQFALGAGLGTRLPMEGGSLVWRPEGFFTYAFSSGFLPHAFSIGVRIGLSFWH